MLKKIKEKLTHVVTKVKNFFNGVVSNIKNGKGKTLYNKVVRFFGARRAKIINPRENNVRNIGSQNININEQQRPLGLYKPPIRTNNNPKREKVGSNSNVTKNGKKERDNNKKIFKAKSHNFSILKNF